MHTGGRRPNAPVADASISEVSATSGEGRGRAKLPRAHRRSASQTSAASVSRGSGAHTSRPPWRPGGGAKERVADVSRGSMISASDYSAVSSTTPERRRGSTSSHRRPASVPPRADASAGSLSRASNGSNRSRSPGGYSQYPQPPLAMHRYLGPRAGSPQDTGSRSSGRRSATGSRPSTRSSSAASSGRSASTAAAHYREAVATEQALMKRFNKRLKRDAQAALDACLVELPRDDMLRQLLRDRQTKHFAAHRIAEVVEGALVRAESRQLTAALSDLAERDDRIASLLDENERLALQVGRAEAARGVLEADLEAALAQRLAAQRQTTFSTKSTSRRSDGPHRAGRQRAPVDYAAELEEAVTTRDEIADELAQTLEATRGQLRASKELGREKTRQIAQLQAAADALRRDVAALAERASAAEEATVRAQHTSIPAPEPVAHPNLWRQAALDVAADSGRLWQLVHTVSKDLSTSLTSPLDSMFATVRESVVTLREAAARRADVLRGQEQHLRAKQSDSTQESSASVAELRTWQSETVASARAGAEATAELAEATLAETRTHTELVARSAASEMASNDCDIHASTLAEIRSEISSALARVSASPISSLAPEALAAVAEAVATQISPSLRRMEEVHGAVQSMVALRRDDAHSTGGASTGEIERIIAAAIGRLETTQRAQLDAVSAAVHSCDRDATRMTVPLIEAVAALRVEVAKRLERSAGELPAPPSCGGRIADADGVVDAPLPAATVSQEDLEASIARGVRIALTEVEQTRLEHSPTTTHIDGPGADDSHRFPSASELLAEVGAAIEHSVAAALQGGSLSPVREFSPAPNHQSHELETSATQTENAADLDAASNLEIAKQEAVAATTAVLSLCEAIGVPPAGLAGPAAACVEVQRVWRATTDAVRNVADLTGVSMGDPPSASDTHHADVLYRVAKELKSMRTRLRLHAEQERAVAGSLQGTVAHRVKAVSGELQRLRADTAAQLNSQRDLAVRGVREAVAGLQAQHVGDVAKLVQCLVEIAGCERPTAVEAFGPMLAARSSRVETPPVADAGSPGLTAWAPNASLSAAARDFLSAIVSSPAAAPGPLLDELLAQARGHQDRVCLRVIAGANALQRELESIRVPALLASEGTLTPPVEQMGLPAQCGGGGATPLPDDLVDDAIARTVERLSRTAPAEHTPPRAASLADAWCNTDAPPASYTIGCVTDSPVLANAGSDPLPPPTSDASVDTAPVRTADAWTTADEAAEALEAERRDHESRSNSWSQTISALHAGTAARDADIAELRKVMATRDVRIEELSSRLADAKDHLAEAKQAQRDLRRDYDGALAETASLAKRGEDITRELLTAQERLAEVEARHSAEFGEVQRRCDLLLERLGVEERRNAALHDRMASSRLPEGGVKLAARNADAHDSSSAPIGMNRSSAVDGGGMDRTSESVNASLQSVGAGIAKQRRTATAASVHAALSALSLQTRHDSGMGHKSPTRARLDNAAENLHYTVNTAPESTPRRRAPRPLAGDFFSPHPPATTPPLAPAVNSHDPPRPAPESEQQPRPTLAEAIGGPTGHARGSLRL